MPLAYFQARRGGDIIAVAQGKIIPMMVIVPQDHRLKIEAWIENKDIGFVHAGQPAEVKVAAFLFTRYSTLTAQILHVSHDAVPLEKVGLTYAARVGLEQSVIQVEGQPVPLSPGMAVTVEIKTGIRRLIEYVLSPLL